MAVQEKRDSTGIGLPLRRLLFSAGVAACVAILLGSTAMGQFSGRGGGGGRHGGGGSKRDSDQSDARRNFKPPPAQIVITPHGGEYLANDTNHYELVYMPLQIRIYLFDNNKMKPTSARNVHAQLSVTFPSESSPRRIPFQHVAMPTGSAEQDYVVAAIDLRQLTDPETPMTFQFSGLPDRKKPTASFTPVFSPSKIRPYVARVLLTEADRAGVMRQRVCPVSGEAIGARGPIVKLYIADFPLYLSGEDCISSVERSPQQYLPRPSAPAPCR